MGRSTKLVVALLVVLALPRSLRAEEHDHAHEEHPVVVIRKLLMAGELDSAEALLAQVHEELEEVERLALGGLIDLQRGRHAEALPKLGRVLALRPTRKAVWLYVGQARFGLGDHEGALAAFREGADVGQKLPGTFLLRARSEKELGRPAAAYATLEEGRRRFPEREDLLREQALVLVELGLVREAMARARAYLERARRDPYAWLVLAEALRDTGRLTEAAQLLEEARLRFPGEERVHLRLAYVYATNEQHSAAARLFEALVARAPKYAFEAADQYRLAGRYRAALRCNGLVEEAARRLRQRLAILLAAERYETAAAMRDDLRAHGIDDAATVYQLAFALANAGRLREAGVEARRLEGGPYAREGKQLRALVASCADKPWFCP